jgi:hypothetical protein
VAAWRETYLTQHRHERNPIFLLHTYFIADVKPDIPGGESVKFGTKPGKWQQMNSPVKVWTASIRNFAAAFFTASSISPTIILFLRKNV